MNPENYYWFAELKICVSLQSDVQINTRPQNIVDGCLRGHTGVGYMSFSKL